MKKTWKVLSIVFLAILVISGALFVFEYSSTSNRAKTIQINEKKRYAKQKLKSCDDYSYESISARYNVKVSDDNSSVTIKTNPSNSSLSNVVLNVISVDLVEPKEKENEYSAIDSISLGSTYSISKSKAATIPLSVFSRLVSGKGEVLLRFNFVAATANSDPLCSGKVGFGSIYETSFDDIELDPSEQQEGEFVDDEAAALEKQLDGGLNGDYGRIDCTNPTDDFSRDYCENGVVDYSANPDKLKKISLNGSDRFPSNVVQDTLKCDFTYKVGGKNVIPAISYKENPNDYFTNISFYETTQNVNKESNGVYRYHLNIADSAKEETIKACKTTCTELVKVEYGPPVASKAGLCFEYVVRVTSNVKCKVLSKPQRPKTYKVCTPKPACKHDSGRVGTNAGPDEEFDQCVQNCDGGKYSTYCSRKCYDTVYNDFSSNVSFDGNDIVAEKIANLDCYSDEYKGHPRERCKCIERKWNKGFTVNNYLNNKTLYGCYFKKDGEYFWSGYNVGKESDHKTPGRYYSRIKHWNYDENRYSIYGEGFFRRTHGSHVCGADCTWKKNDCVDGKTYLNPGWKAEDKMKNMEKYKAALKSCTAAAIKCSTTSTTFKIGITGGEASVDGTGGKPNDQLITKEDNTCSNPNDSATKNYLLDYNGCYKKCMNGKQVYYKGTWSFPGSWINYKTGEVVYNNPNTSGYGEYEHKYCIPLNAKNVNTKWWNYYYTLKFGDSNVSINSSTFQNECNKGGTGKSCNYKVYSVNESDIDYNILAETRAFGHFKWNFDIKCFYALNTNICDPNGSGSGNTDPKCTGGLQKSIRTVDLADMFPNKDGATHSAETSGRDPGFNWSQYSSYAAVGSDKTGSYLGQPQEYMKWVQKLGDNVYNDRYLDYQVRLSKNDINMIKNKIKNGLVYNNFQDGSRGNVDVNSVVNYRSNLLRIDLSNKTILPNDNALKCNNMKNHNGGCEDLSR